MNSPINTAKRLVKAFSGNVLNGRRGVEENRVLFIVTRSHFDNCLALLDHLMRTEGGKLKYGLMADGADYAAYRQRFAGSGVRVVSMKKNPVEAARLLATSRYVFCMHHGRPFEDVRRREGQALVNLWHGSGYKAAPAPEYGKDYAADFDALLVPGPLFVETKARYFHCGPERIWPLGYPRYDQMLRPAPGRVEAVRGAWLREAGQKLLLWMPTYRQARAGVSFGEQNLRADFDLPLLSGAGELNELDRRCGERGVFLLIKRHPHQYAYSCEGCAYEHVAFADNAELGRRGMTLAELMTASDGLISDYSSASVDYLLLGRPIAYSLDDLAQYGANRGFVFDDPTAYMPGHHLYGFSDLTGFLDDIASGTDRFAAERARLMPLLHNPCDGYCARIWDAVRQRL